MTAESFKKSFTEQTFCPQWGKCFPKVDKINQQKTSFIAVANAMMEANKNLQNSKNRQLEMPPKTNNYYWVPSKPPTITVRLCEDENNKVNGIKMSND